MLYSPSCRFWQQFFIRHGGTDYFSLTGLESPEEALLRAGIGFLVEMDATWILLHVLMHNIQCSIRGTPILK
jgi:hypothetical protein